MTKEERVIAALNLQPTDRTPAYDLIRNDDLIQHYTGSVPPIGDEGLRAVCKTTAACLDMTRSLRSPGEETEQVDKHGIVWGFERWTRWIIRRPFEDLTGTTDYIERKVDDFNNEDIAAMADQIAADFNKRRNYLGDDTVILLRDSGTGLDWLREELGWELFSYATVDAPDHISAYLEAYTNREIKLIDELVQKIWSPCALTYGDIAYKGALLHSPAWLRREFFPRLKRLNEAYHKHNVKCLFHSDGYLMDVMPDLIESGIDGLNPVETLAGMNLAEIKKLYGDKLFITGAIDVSQLLPYASVDEVVKVCEESIRAASPGFFIGSSTELGNGVKLENILAMFKAAGAIEYYE